MRPALNRGWWERRKWTVVFVGGFLLAAFIAGVLSLTIGGIKRSDVYQEAIAELRANPSVRQALGTPIREGLFVTGTLSTTNEEGEAILAIPVSGPKNRGRLYLSATRSAGTWRFSALVVELAGTEEQIDLLH